MSSSTESSKTSAPSEFEGNLEVLRRMPFFAEMPMETVKVFAYLCTRESYKPDDILFHQGEDDAQAYHVLSGTVRVVLSTPDGEATVGEHGEGETFGVLTLVGSMPRLFTLKAVTEATCLQLTRERFTKTVEQFPDLMPRFLQSLVKNIHEWERKFLGEHGGECESCRRKAGVSLL